MHEAVLYQRDGAIATITLNRPDQRNSMSTELLDAFAVAVERARSDAEMRCLIVTGTGNCFSAGADLRGSVQRGGAQQVAHERSYAMYQPFLSLLDVEVPVIAALNGHAVGGGFGLALVCDLRVAARGSRYGANFTRLGFHPGMGITYLLPRIAGVQRAAELLFSARLISGEEMVEYGLALEAVESAQVGNRAGELAATIAANAPIAMRMTKRSLYEGLGWQVKNGAFREAFAQSISLMSEDANEGMSALLEKREPKFDGR
jgi:enoyl-CoA hydratase/carnithine racemase